MKIVILAGGLGTRLGSTGKLMPKPMVKVAGKPILVHVMKIYSHYGFNEFVICLGYRGDIIKDYFFNFNNQNNDFTVNTENGQIDYHNFINEKWKVTLVDTGLDTLKGGRIKRIEPYLDSEYNMLTYGDGVANININNLLDFHKKHQKILTITGVKPPSMFGEILTDNDEVLSFEEKPQTSQGLINGGFMVFNRKLLDYLSTDASCDFEFGPMEDLAKEKEVMCFNHGGFWECADTVRDIANLESLWKSGNAEWKVW